MGRGRLLLDEYLQENASFDRLLKEYKEYGCLYIGFDFDNTVYDFHKKGNTYTDVIGLLRDLKDIGCKLICWTACKDPEFPRQYMIDNDIPFDSINEGGIPLESINSPKLMFSALLDDRAGLLQVFQELTILVEKIKKVKHYESTIISR